MLYAILSPEREAPWGYYRCDTAPTIEQLADHMAALHGLPSRDDWIELNHVDLLGWAPVH